MVNYYIEEYKPYFKGNFILINNVAEKYNLYISEYNIRKYTIDIYEG